MSKPRTIRWFNLPEHVINKDFRKSKATADHGESMNSDTLIITIFETLMEENKNRSSSSLLTLTNNASA